MWKYDEWNKMSSNMVGSNMMGGNMMSGMGIRYNYYFGNHPKNKK